MSKQRRLYSSLQISLHLGLGTLLLSSCVTVAIICQAAKSVCIILLAMERLGDRGIMYYAFYAMNGSGFLLPTGVRHTNGCIFPELELPLHTSLYRGVRDLENVPMI